MQSEGTDPSRLPNGESARNPCKLHIPTAMSEPLTGAITTAVQDSITNVGYPLKCGAIGIPESFNTTMCFFVARIYRTVCNDASIMLETVLWRLQALRLFYNLDHCGRSPTTPECAAEGLGIYIGLESNLLRIYLFDVEDELLRQIEYSTSEMETPLNASLIESHLTRFLQTLRPYTTLRKKGVSPTDQILQKLDLKHIILDIDLPTDQLDPSILPTIQSIFRNLPIPILQPNSSHTAAYSAALGTARYGRRTL